MELKCIECGKILINKQKRFCSVKCTYKWRKETGKKREYDHNFEARIRTKVFIYYGGNPPKCANCGFDNILALEIDHINNNGREHREKEKIGSGSNTYRWLVKNNFPEGYQIICANCNKIKIYKSGILHRDFLLKEI